MLRSPLMLWRLLGIARTLARHDALAAVEKTGLAPTLTALLRRLIPRRRAGRPGQNLARAFVELGPSFIKLGQFLATRADLIGEEMARDLAELQDRLPPFPSAEARRVIAAELGAPVEALFTRFEEAPVSAASIAQVHFAVTRPQGPAPEAGPDAVAEAPREVAVKVLRPGVEEKLERDLRLLYWIARLAERTEPRLRRFRPVALVAEFERVVKTEMDLRLEAAGADELAENFAGDESYRVPAVDWGAHRPARADHGAHRRHPHGRPRGAAGGRPRPARGAGEGGGDLLPPGLPRRLLPRRPAPRQHVRRRRGQHRRRRLRHHGPA